MRRCCMLLSTAVLAMAAPPGVASDGYRVEPATELARDSVAELVFELEREIATDQEGVILPAGVASMQLALVSGRIVVGPTHDRNILVLDERDRPVGAVGRPGEGPGEFPGAPWALDATRGGEVVALHRNRVTRIDPERAEIISQVSLPRVVSRLVVLGSEGFAAIVGPDLSGAAPPGLAPSVAFFDADGEVQGAAELPDLTPGAASPEVAALDAMRILAASSRGAVWAAPVRPYQLDLVARDGTVLQSIRREVSWFPPLARDDGRSSLERPPNPQIMDIREDGEGRIWVAIWVASRDWAPMPLPDTPPLPWAPPPFEPSSIFDTVIEVLDPESGALLAQGRSPHPLRFASGDDGFVWAPLGVTSVDPTIGVWSVRLGERR